MADSTFVIGDYIAIRYNCPVKGNTADQPEADDFESTLSQLAHLRYLLRKFVRFSEGAARKADITPQQHQLMLGIAGFKGSGRATVSELADFLQERHHSVVGLIDRATLSGLVRRETDQADRRVVFVSLTPRGRSLLKRLSLQHHDEVNRLRDELLTFARQSIAQKPASMHTNQTTNIQKYSKNPQL